MFSIVPVNCLGCERLTSNTPAEKQAGAGQNKGQVGFISVFDTLYLGEKKQWRLEIASRRIVFQINHIESVCIILHHFYLSFLPFFCIILEALHIGLNGISLEHVDSYVFDLFAIDLFKQYWHLCLIMSKNIL